ncbi:histidine phosphatase family protein [Neptuniibacter sp. 1_MG-2023]|jgi:phosphohistidine phosphatase|uniref:SixA phosphatase family protein n=1 Tax=Neptuniibacter sp. 1_MG-2023 TaxID=3062662 RepID=UPI0026E2EA23|nr:histidine phosphatase family protein [Neptuniibacter sp. 1_MG-2023]MDO6594780.1 histidine phosphatase family protein [Neptuniibacter sp. 1_MG-2023]
MKKLTLVRHAKSSWKHPELTDFERPLNKRGKRDLPAMVERLADYQLTPDTLLSSGATRTLSTAKAICSRLAIPQNQILEIPELYESSAETLLLVLQNMPESYKHIMLVGHNPGLEHLASILRQESVTKFPTAAVMHLHLSIKNWHELAEGCASLSLFDYPKKHITSNE